MKRDGEIASKQVLIYLAEGTRGYAGPHIVVIATWFSGDNKIELLF